jgi:hypothetical protein
MAKRTGCQVFVPDPEDRDFEIECGKKGDGYVTVNLPTGKGHANVRVCATHKRIINSRAAALRTSSKQVR